ncbi:hypothetical protein [Mycetocola saprophilus]|uniref:hypothetical protein n=1 Tax=Mycetocola saprophilus TaxID=76636 RepID=UPI00068E57F4|nr:hypothetical protein [Mycetocola saprophilus]
MDVLVVADQRGEAIGFIDTDSASLTDWWRGQVVAEHAGILPLGGGKCAWVDDAGGALVVVDALARQVRERVSVAIPGEHLACDPSGRFLGVSTGLGASWEPWSDLVSVVDLDAPEGPRSRRVRTRAGEPGVIVTGGAHPPRVVLRHREPGALESLDVAEILRVGVHCPELHADEILPIGDTGHGDVYDPVSGQMWVATDRGLECFDVTGVVPRSLGVRPWVAPGRAYFLRFCPRRRVIVAVLRQGGDAPRDWADWENTLWVHTIDTGQTRTAPLGRGLIFRFALTATGIAVARVHPEGDDLAVFDLDAAEAQVGNDPARSLAAPPVGERAPVAGSPLGLRGTWSLTPMDRAPKPGVEPWDDADRRAIAASARDERVALTRGGHGEVLLIDTGNPSASPVTIRVPGALRDGGHLAWIDATAPAPGDLVGR